MRSADWCEVNDLDVGLQLLKQVEFGEGSFGFILDFVMCGMFQVVTLVLLRCYSYCIYCIGSGG